MLSHFTRHRPKHLTAVYVESRRVEILRAHRQWRTWEIDSTEQFAPHVIGRFYSELRRSWQIDTVEHSASSDAEPLFDLLQRLNLRPRRKKGTALILFLPRPFYDFHREIYPLTLQDHLDEALTYDWQENIFYEQERSLHFFGPPVVVDQHVSVPIFSIQREIYDRFMQVLGGPFFETAVIIPSALAYRTFLSDDSPAGEPSLSPEMLGRIVDESQMEIHRFCSGQLLDSLIIRKGKSNQKLFHESMQCAGNAESEHLIRILATWSSEECHGDYGADWKEELPIQTHTVQDPLVSYMVKHFLDQDEIRTFDAPLLLKPWEIPKIAWPILGAVAIFLIFAAYQTYSLHQLRRNNMSLTRQISHLESQWKPIEKLQSQISKFQEDQKTLSEFKRAGYPLLEMLTLLTQITPDDTWINYLSLRNSQLMLRGESKSAIKYLSDLSKVDGFSDVKFASPVTRNPSSDLERFNVQAQIDVEKLQKATEALPAEKMDTKTADDSSIDFPVPGSEEEGKGSFQFPTPGSEDTSHGSIKFPAPGSEDTSHGSIQLPVPGSEDTSKGAIQSPVPGSEEAGKVQ